MLSSLSLRVGGVGFANFAALMRRAAGIALRFEAPEGADDAPSYTADRRRFENRPLGIRRATALLIANATRTAKCRIANILA
jgi:hypothetical protein